MILGILGHRGQVGTELKRLCVERGLEAFNLDVDVTKKDDLKLAISSRRPDAVINCAAWTAVDDCESDPERAMLVNGTAVGWIAEACDSAGVHLVHISTDYVFDGLKESPYEEGDPTNPQSVYGRSKLRGEEEALKFPFAVARTSWVCGEFGNNMLKTIMRLAGERDSISFVDDQVGNPTLTCDLAAALLRLAEDRKRGTFHVTNRGAVSWYEFAREVVRLIGKDPDMVRPIKTHELSPPRPAKRPANSVLNDAVWRAAGYHPMRDFKEPLAEAVFRLYKNKHPV